MDKSSKEYEEWINGFSGLDGRSTISKEPTLGKTLELSDFVRVTKEPIG